MVWSTSRRLANGVYNMPLLVASLSWRRDIIAIYALCCASCIKKFFSMVVSCCNGGGSLGSMSFLVLFTSTCVCHS